jgi:23S rRNA pseudouridine1911/1915/1917 synthase
VRYTVPAPVTVGDCLARLLATASGRTRKQLLAAGRIRVNGTVVERADTPLDAGDVLEVAPRTSGASLPRGLALVYEDDDVIVVDKPAGLLTIATERERERTAYAYLMARAHARRPPARIFVVHRLDRGASGLLVFATSAEAKRQLQAQFAAHTVERTYLAVVDGRLASSEGTITSRLVDAAAGPVQATRRSDRGRAAVTRWRRLRAGTHHTLLEVRLETGRRNQIRVHLAGKGHPVAGDTTYGSRTDPLGRLALHAHVLGFDHPCTGRRLRFVSPAPRGFAKRSV